MRKWEYCIHGFAVDQMPNKTINDELTALGDAGWEIISVGWPNHAFVLLKREQPQ